MQQSNLPTLSELKWRCRRGMLELDLLLGPYVEQQYPSLNAADQALFVRLLNERDDELFAWLMGHVTPQDKDFARMCQMIHDHACHRT